MSEKRIFRVVFSVTFVSTFTSLVKISDFSSKTQQHILANKSATDLKTKSKEAHTTCLTLHTVAL